MFSRGESFILLCGDLVVFVFSLWLSLVVRYLEMPPLSLFEQHLVPFAILFGVWILVFFIAGLYDRHTVLFKQHLTELIIKTLIVNVILAALFFFLIPYFGITPKTILFIYLIISWLLVLLWRLFLATRMGVREPEHALLISEGKEADELFVEINGNIRYGLHFTHRIHPTKLASMNNIEQELRIIIAQGNITTIVADTRNEKTHVVLPVLYTLLYEEKNFVFLDTLRLYEQIFRRIPLSMLDHTWFLEHLTTRPRIMYNIFHRATDIIGAIILGIPTILLVPFVALAIYLEDKGPLTSIQVRVGRYGEPLRLIKFRTMRFNDGGVWNTDMKNEVTRVGGFLRTWRIDELPQLWNVLAGSYSLIGPRPEFAQAVASYTQAIPYYPTRNLITPGLSGWAQIYHEGHPHHGVDIEETKNKLSHDLYYLKNRSLVLDIEIALKTIRTLVSRSGV